MAPEHTVEDADRPPEATRPEGFISNNTGRVAQLLRSFSFSDHSLGPMEGWSQPLRSAVSLMLDSHFPMFVAWGKELTLLYNDAYSELLGSKHPAALGARFQDVWKEIWKDILPLIEKAMNGVATFSEDLPLVVNRKGYDELGWFTFSYSPVRDESGVVCGMFCAVSETTERVMLQNRQAFHLALEEKLRDLGVPVDVMATASEALGKELGVARVGYGEIDDAEEHVIVDRDWTDTRIASVAGTYRMMTSGLQ